jgi:hypothetical protein
VTFLFAEIGAVKAITSWGRGESNEVPPLKSRHILSQESLRLAGNSAHGVAYESL